MYYTLILLTLLDKTCSNLRLLAQHKLFLHSTYKFNLTTTITFQAIGQIISKIARIKQFYQR